MPEGNRSCSWLIICRFIGMARKTPSAAVKNTNAAATGQGCCTPVMSSSAPSATASVAPVEEPAAVAVDCMQLFSRMLMRETRPAKILQMAFQTTKEMTQAVMDTPKLQPIFSVV